MNGRLWAGRRRQAGALGAAAKCGGRSPRAPVCPAENPLGTVRGRLRTEFQPRSRVMRCRRMDAYILLLVGAGVLVLLVAWLPTALCELPLSLPIVCVALGVTLFALSNGDMPLPLEPPRLTERLTELIVIIALTGAGLKIDRPFRFRDWSATWWLLLVAMPLSIAGMALISQVVLGLGVATALLLGAVLAPTDPVLAADVQVGPPRWGEEDEVRFTLTAEAGLNDGLAFPFVNLATAAVAHAALPGVWLLNWAVVDIVWKLAVGATAGLVIGRALGWLIFRVPNRAGLSRTGDGFVALGVTFLAYGLTDLAHGYGFLAVLIAALPGGTLRIDQNATAAPRTRGDRLLRHPGRGQLLLPCLRTEQTRVRRG